MKKQLLLSLALLSGAQFVSAAPIPIPPLDLSLAMDFSKREINIDGKCYADMDQNVLASGGSQVMITNGNCTDTNVSTMGKAGDLKRFNVAQLQTINLGNVDEVKYQKVAAPAVGEKNAVLLTFTPSNPEGTRLVPGQHLKGRQVQALLKTRDLTKALATAEEAQWITGKGQVLLELWARTNPSVFGNDDFKQFANIALLKSQVGQEFVFGATANGSVSLNFSANNDMDPSAPPVIYQLEGNVTSQKP